MRLVLQRGAGEPELQAVNEPGTDRSPAREVLRLGTQDLILIASEAVATGYFLVRVELQDAQEDGETPEIEEVATRLRSIIRSGGVAPATDLMSQYAEYYYVAWVVVRDEETLTNVRVGRNGALLAAGNKSSIALTRFVSLVQRLLPRLANG